MKTIVVVLALAMVVTNGYWWQRDQFNRTDSAYTLAQVTALELAMIKLQQHHGPWDEYR